MHTEGHSTEQNEVPTVSEAAEKYLFADLTGSIIAAAHRVQSTLGCGFLEKVYENALALELVLSGRKVEAQRPFQIAYRGQSVGCYYADMVVDECVIVEAKAVTQLDNVHRAQLLNYLKASGMRVGLLINFARPRLEYERFVV
jgi:GxxExxY protein